MAQGSSKSRVRRTTATPAAGTFGMPFAAAFAVLAFIGVVAGFVLQGSVAVSLDYAAIFTAIAGAFAAIGLLAGRDLGMSRSRLTYAWAAFIGWALLSALVSGRPWASLVGEPASMLGLAVLAAMTAATLAAVRYAPQVRRIFETCGWYVLLGESAVVFWQLATHAVAGGTLPNSSYLGEALLLILPWTLSARDAPKWQRWPRIVTVVVTLAAMAASGARVATVVGVVWVVWAIARDASWSVRVRALSLVGLVAVVLGAGLVFARAETTGAASVEALGERPAMARISVAAVALRPVLGWGPDGYRDGGSAASTVQLAESGPMTVVAQGAGDPHDLLLWVVASTGLVGLALFLWFGAETALRWRQRLRQDVDAWPPIWAVAGACVMLLTAPAYPAVLPLLALALGVSIAGPGPDHRDGAPEGALPVAVGLAALIVLAVACGVLALDAGVRSSFEDVTAARSPGIAANSLSIAGQWSVDPHLWLLASRHVGQAMAENPASFADSPDLAALERAQALDALDPDYPLGLAWRLQAHQAPAAQVEQAYQREFELYPLQPQARADFALYLAGLGRGADAAKQLEVARILMAKDPANTAPLQPTIAQAEAAIAALGQ